MKKIKINERQAKLLGLKMINENDGETGFKSAGVAVPRRIVISGQPVPKLKELIVKLISRVDSEAKLNFFEATGKLVGTVTEIRIESIKRELKAIDTGIKEPDFGEKGRGEIVKFENGIILDKSKVKNLVKITKEHYKKLVSVGLIKEDQSIVRGGLNRVDKTFKKEFAGKDIKNMGPIGEGDFNIKKPNPSMSKGVQGKFGKPMLEGGDEIKNQTIDLIKYLYRKTEDFSPFWEEHGLTYDDICDTLLSNKLIVSNNGKYVLSKTTGSPQKAIQAVEDALIGLIKPVESKQETEIEEGGDLPAGAENDPRAPYNQSDDDYTTPKMPKNTFLTVIAKNGEIAILKDKKGSLYMFYYGEISKDAFVDYASVKKDFVGKDEEGQPEFEYSDEFDIDGDVIERYLNDNLENIDKGEGLEAYERGVDLVKIDNQVKQELMSLYDKDKSIASVLGGIQEMTTNDMFAGFKNQITRHMKNDDSPNETPEEKQARIAKKIADIRAREMELRKKEAGEVDETTGADSSGAFTGALSMPMVKKEMPVDVNKLNVPIVGETTAGSGSVGAYDANALPGINRDGSFKETKKSGAQKKTQYAGGAFVEFDDCTKMNNKPAGTGCSKGAVDNVVKLKKTQGNINAPSLSESYIREALKLQHDKKANKLIVISDLEGKAASQETFSNKNVLKKNGFIWTGTNWAIPTDKLEVAKQTLSLINKAEYLISTLEDVEEAIDSSAADNKSLLKAKLDQYISDLANATDEAALSAEIRRYLTFFSKFHDYSFFNRILIFIQRPDAKRVASYKKWQEKFRQVKKGSKAITILAPIITKDKSVPDNEPSLGMGEFNRDKDVRGFRAVNVFDISDTEPMDERGDIPDEPQWWGENTPSETADELFMYASEVASDLGIKVTQSDAKGGEKGFAAGDHINISSDVSGAGRLSTMIHEIAHELMHFKAKSIFYQDDEVRGSSALKELQAESVSYVVLKHYGLPVSHHTTYLALWKANKEKIQSNLEVISKVAQFIIGKIDEEAERNTKNKEVAKTQNT